MWFRRKPSKRRRPVAEPPALATHSEAPVSTLQRVRLPVDLLQIGMRIISLDRPWTQVPVLFQGFTLTDDKQIQMLRQYCEWVLVEDEETRLIPVLDQVALLKRRTSEPLPETRSLQEELPRAQITWNQTQAFVENVAQQIESGNSDLNLQSARPIVRECVESVKANASAMFWMSRIKSRDAYTAEHCLRVAIFCVAFARFLGMADEELEIVGMCGLLHDLGKLKVPGKILNKPGPLTTEEHSIMCQHTTLGYELLRTDPNLDPIISDVSCHHHERMDGCGYPKQLAEWQISRFARLVSIVDAFDALTSDRCYRDGLPTSEAIRVLFRNRGQQFDATMVEAFIRMIGVYPPGSLVELSTGEVAIVLATHPGRKLKPKVEVLLDANKQPIKPLVIDLGATGSDSGQDSPEIARPLPDGAFGISLQDRIKQLMAADNKNAS